MVGMIIKIGVASILAYISFTMQWWAPIIVFPVAFWIVPSFGKGESFSVNSNEIQARRAVFYLLCIAYTIIGAILFHNGLSSWYGWIIGIILAWLGCGSIAADLEKFLYFRTHQ